MGTWARPSARNPRGHQDTQAWPWAVWSWEEWGVPPLAASHVAAPWGPTELSASDARPNHPDRTRCPVLAPGSACHASGPVLFCGCADNAGVRAQGGRAEPAPRVPVPEPPPSTPRTSLPPRRPLPPPGPGVRLSSRRLAPGAGSPPQCGPGMPGLPWQPERQLLRRMTEGPSRPQPLIFSEAAVSCERLEGRALGPGEAPRSLRPPPRVWGSRVVVPAPSCGSRGCGSQSRSHPELGRGWAPRGRPGRRSAVTGSPGRAELQSLPPRACARGSRLPGPSPPARE